MKDYNMQLNKKRATTRDGHRGKDVHRVVSLETWVLSLLISRGFVSRAHVQEAVKQNRCCDGSLVPKIYLKSRGPGRRSASASDASFDGDYVCAQRHN